MTIHDCVVFAQVDMVSAGVVGVIALIAIVCAILAAKTWHWVNIVFLVLTMLVGIWATTGMTQVYKLRRDAMLEYKREEDRAIKAEEELQIQLGGDMMSPMEIQIEYCVQ